MSPARIDAPTDFPTARRALLDAALAAGATVRSHLHPRTGPEGEPLFCDVARFGPPPGKARTVVTVSSGVHGIEGHTGSAVQRLLVEGGHLDRVTDDGDVAVVLVHAVNPFGMMWNRRVDHDNIDVNRNFVDFTASLPENPDYGDVAAALNPVDLDLEDDAWQGEILDYAARRGNEVMFHAVSGGQYRVPEGVQYGGQAPCWSRTTLETIWAEHFGGADAVWHLDLHTGLGAWGGLLTFQTADADEPAAQLAAAVAEHHFRVDRNPDGGSIQLGVLGPGLDGFCARTFGAPGAGGPQVVALVLEWGVHDEVRTLTAMRADNWLHAHGRPSHGEPAHRIAAMMRDVFAPDDPEWRAKVAADAIGAVERVLDRSALSDEPVGG